MRSMMVLPYCPIPADHGGKVEMRKVLACLRELGPCTILSARTRPVGMGWTREATAELSNRGFDVVLREDDEPRKLRANRVWGMVYAAGCKALRLDRAFGHANPYHRSAFDPAWVARHSESKDLAVFAYSFWAGFPTACPKACLLLDLWSDYMWGGTRSELRDLRTADLAVVISKQEEARLRSRGVNKVLWSPPFVDSVELADSRRIGIIGSSNTFNRKGLRWLGKGLSDSPVNVFGGLSEFAVAAGFEPRGRYADAMDPYRECGIILMTAVGGTGVQIKSIEALAAGRAIIARRGAMRGIPDGNGAWIDVDTPEEMRAAAVRLRSDTEARRMQMAAAREYCHAHLDADLLRVELRDALLNAARESTPGGGERMKPCWPRPM